MIKLIAVHRVNDRTENGKVIRSSIEMILNAAHITRIEEIPRFGEISVVCIFMDDGQNFFVTETFEEVKSKILNDEKI